MGLDMYLTKEIYVGANYKHNGVRGEINLTTNGMPIKINLNKVVSIQESFAYWRKANQIHNWFVKNVQKGVDDCGTYYVSAEKLQKLVETCKEVLDNHELAEELLPTCSGFFFGDTKYDEYYFADLQDTINMLSDIDEECDYIYHASW